MFDLEDIWRLIQVEPGHNLVIVAILARIWWNTRGIPVLVKRVEVIEEDVKILKAKEA